MPSMNFAEMPKPPRDEGASKSSRNDSRSRARDEDYYDDDYFNDDYDDRHGGRKKRGRRKSRRMINPWIIVVLLLVVGGIIAALMIFNPFGNGGENNTDNTSTVVQPEVVESQSTAPNTQVFDGVWRPVSFKTGDGAEIISDADIRIALVRGYGNGIMLNADGSGQFLLMTDDSMAVALKDYKNSTEATIEDYLAKDSKFEWTKENEKEASTTLDVSKIDVSALKSGVKHAPFKTGKLQLRQNKLFLTFDDGSYISFQKESDNGTTLGLPKLTDEEKTAIETAKAAFAPVNDAYSVDEVSVKLGVNPTVTSDKRIAYWADDANTWCAVCFCDKAGQLTGQTIWVDRAGGYEEHAATKQVDEGSSSASSASATKYEKGSLTEDMLKELKALLEVNPNIERDKVEVIIGKADSQVDSTDEALTGYAWNAADGTWQLQIFFDKDNKVQKLEELREPAEATADTSSASAEKPDAEASGAASDTSADA